MPATSAFDREPREDVGGLGVARENTQHVLGVDLLVAMPSREGVSLVDDACRVRSQARHPPES